jgi:hypothetical protein
MLPKDQVLFTKRHIASMEEEKKASEVVAQPEASLEV